MSTVTNNVGGPQSAFAVTRLWRATDSCGNTSVCSQTITVMDTTPPTVTCATNKTVACGVAWDFDPPVALDQLDGTNVVITISGTLTNVSCALGSQATRTWRATDAHGNVADCSQTVSIPHRGACRARVCPESIGGTWDSHGTSRHRL